MPINPYFLTFESLIYLVFVGSLWHARQQGGFHALELVWAALYGFLLEWLTIKQLDAYHYGQFLIMIDGAPLCIALGWAVVIYSGMEFSNRIQLPDSARSILDALMALNIDLAFDVVAIRLGMWAWNGIGPDQQWFGVPWANFWAWFIVVWSYSGFIRALRPWQHNRLRRWMYAPFALVLSLFILIATSELYRFMTYHTGISILAPLLLIVGSLLIVLDFRPRVLHSGLPEPIVIAVPILFHAFAMLAGISSGVFGKQPVLGLIGVTMLVVGLMVHLSPWWGRSRRLEIRTPVEKHSSVNRFE